MTNVVRIRNIRDIKTKTFCDFETQLRIIEFFRFVSHSVFNIIMYNCGLGRTELVVNVDTIKCNTKKQIEKCHEIGS